MAEAGVASRLTARGKRLASAYGAPLDTVEAVIADVVARYSEPHRHYHTLEHVEEVLAVVDDLGGTRDVEWAAWLHDVIYDVHAPDSEARSAGYAAEVLAQLRVPDDEIGEVQRLIELSARHDVVAGDKNGAVAMTATCATFVGNSPISTTTCGALVGWRCCVRCSRVSPMNGRGQT